MYMLAIGHRIADVIGAAIAIIAIFEGEPKAGPRGTGVVIGTWVAIVTGENVIYVHTARGLVTGVGRTVVSVVAIICGTG